MKYPYIFTELTRFQWAILTESLEEIFSLVQGDIELLSRENYHSSDINVSAPILGDRPSDTVLTRVNGSVGSLSINGPIVPRASSITESSGIVSIDRLVSEFKALEDNPQIKNIVLVFDSPGGAITGVSDFAKMVAKSTKSTTSYVYGTAASAAYWIASASDKIIASDTALLGSIGTLLSVDVSKDDKKVVLISSQSPNKRADVTTKEGRESIQTILDTLADIFIESVAQNRGVSTKTVIEDFGQGGLVVASQAVKLGMLDSVKTLDELITSFEEMNVSVGSISDVNISSKAIINNKNNYVGDLPTSTMKSKNDFMQKELGSMDQLKKLIAEHNLTAEHESLLESARCEGVAKEKTRITEAAKTVKPFLMSVVYPAGVKSAAVDVITGEQELSFLLGAVSNFDTTVASNEEANAVSDSEETPVVKPQVSETSKYENDGIIRSAQDVNLELNKRPKGVL